MAIALVGCSAFPNLDHSVMACQNAQGIGPIPSPVGGPDGPIPLSTPGFEAELVGKSPREATAIAEGMGHTVVFNVQIPGYGECWCKPPPMGTVVLAFWNGHGALELMVQGVDVGHTPGDQPLFGWECG